ncbi:MAG TPA: SCO1664 family protein [Candidatus Saccharimonadia bacterium]|nr:SCO1664 family protein [Candidatus Saccharimonadia bacterium]
MREGELELDGRLVDASNASFVGFARHAGSADIRCVYKPIAGEAPLWDFPDGTLAHREVAAYLVSEAARWTVVPVTVFRDDGPFGAGMAQQWIDVDESYDLVAALRSGTPALRRIALFDAVVNNTDRKGGHLLPLPDGRLLGVDHGVCFSVEPKLRTILWGWRGTPLSDDEIAELRQLRTALGGPLRASLEAHLHEDEINATVARVDLLLVDPRFPMPNPDWPAVPWPPF